MPFMVTHPKPFPFLFSRALIQAVIETGDDYRKSSFKPQVYQIIVFARLTPAQFLTQLLGGVKLFFILAALLPTFCFMVPYAEDILLSLRVVLRLAKLSNPVPSPLRLHVLLIPYEIK